jgi:hypothetical protein
VGVEIIGKPWLKPTTEDYVNARLPEALVEASSALRFLKDCLIGDASSKGLIQIAKGMRKWLMKKAVPRVPTSRVKALTQMLEEIGYCGLSTWLSTVLELHDYQCNGPDPDMTLSNYRNEEESAKDIVLLIGELVRHVEKLKARVRWDSNALEGLRNLGKWQGLVLPIGECSEED